MALLLMGVARLQALLPAPVVSYTTISPLLPEERFVSVARSGRSLRPGRYPASRSMECGLSSPPEGGATTWLTWGLHHNMFENFLEGKGRWYINTKNKEESIFQNHQWGGQIALCILKCPFETVRNDWRNTLGLKIITKTRKTERKAPIAEPFL